MSTKKRPASQKGGQKKRRKVEIETAADVDPRIFLAQRDVVADICRSLDTTSLYRFIQTSKTVREVCSEILAGRKNSELIIRNARKINTAIVAEVRKHIDGEIAEVPQTYFRGARGEASRRLRQGRKYAPDILKESLLPQIMRILENAPRQSLTHLESKLSNSLFDSFFTDDLVEYRLFGEREVPQIIRRAVEKVYDKLE